MQDTNGKTIIGYHYGMYWFQVTRNRISALSGCSYKSESELLLDYDNVQGDYENSPKLVRVYSDGTELQLRPRYQTQTQS